MSFKTLLQIFSALIAIADAWALGATYHAWCVLLVVPTAILLSCGASWVSDGRELKRLQEECEELHRRQLDLIILMSQGGNDGAV